MAITLTVSPTYPIPGREAQVSFSASAAGNYVRCYCTAAPLGSEYRTKLDALETTGSAKRILVWTADVSDIWNWTPTVGGVYTFAAEELTRGASTHGGGYYGDPTGYQSETIVATTTGLTIEVGSKLTAQIGVGADLATLELYVFGTYVRATTLATHEQLTPALTSPASGRARTAAESSTVAAALSALADKTASTILGTPSASIADLIEEFNDHRAQSGVHAANDSDNTIAASYEYAPGSPAGVARSANELRLKLSRHMQNDNAGAGIGSAAYHAIGGTARADQLHGLIVSGANEQDALSHCLMIADLWRAYEAHRVDTSFHTVADTTNTAAALGDLLELYVAFLTALQAASPTVPPAENGGSVLLVHSGGMKAG